jgi:hypothetical protein
MQGTSDLVDERALAVEQRPMGFVPFAITVQHPPQLELERLPVLHLRVAVLLHRGVADLVAFGLTGLGEQDQRCGVGRLCANRSASTPNRSLPNVP